MTKIHLLEGCISGCYFAGDSTMRIVDTGSLAPDQNVVTVSNKQYPIPETQSLVIPLLALAAAYMVLK